jgi:hypothetical protein
MIHYQDEKKMKMTAVNSGTLAAGTTFKGRFKNTWGEYDEKDYHMVISAGARFVLLNLKTGLTTPMGTGPYIDIDNYREVELEVKELK